MGDYERTETIAKNVFAILKREILASPEEPETSLRLTSLAIAKHIMAREKALHKIIAAAIQYGDHFDGDTDVRTKYHEYKIPCGLLAKFAPELEVEGDGGESITVRFRSY